MKKGSVKKTEKKVVKKKDATNKLLILMVACVLLSLITLAIVAYDKVIKPDRNTCVNC